METVILASTTAALFGFSDFLGGFASRKDTALAQIVIIHVEVNREQVDGYCVGEAGGQIFVLEFLGVGAVSGRKFACFPCVERCFSTHASLDLLPGEIGKRRRNAGAFDQRLSFGAFEIEHARARHPCRAARREIAILGTDIDAETIRTAQQAEYIEERLKEVPAGLKDRYFRQTGSRFRLVPELREMVTFLQGDITRTAEYVASDLVVCRNTLIYFTRPDQEKILGGVADILPPGGILVLGKSETLVGDVRQRFESICPVERIYRRL